MWDDNVMSGEETELGIRLGILAKLPSFSIESPQNVSSMVEGPCLPCLPQYAHRGYGLKLCFPQISMLKI